MIDSNFLIGAPKILGKLCKVYPPKVREIIENENFPFFRQIILITQEELEDMKVDNKVETFMTPFEFLFYSAKKSKEIEKIIKEGFEFFFHEPVTFFYDLKMIVIGDLEKEISSIKSVSDLRTIREDDYFKLQNIFRAALGEEPVKPYEFEKNERIREIKAKGRLREKVKKKKGKGISLGTLLTAICCMGIGITPLNIGEISFASINYLKDMMQNKEKYETDIRSLLAGADSKKIKPKYWICESDEN